MRFFCIFLWGESPLSLAFPGVSAQHKKRAFAIRIDAMIAVAIIERQQREWCAAQSVPSKALGFASDHAANQKLAPEVAN
jgi:hypothetical protein